MFLSVTGSSCNSLSQEVYIIISYSSPLFSILSFLSSSYIYIFFFLHFSYLFLSLTEDLYNYFLLFSSFFPFLLFYLHLSFFYIYPIFFYLDYLLQKIYIIISYPSPLSLFFLFLPLPILIYFFRLLYFLDLVSTYMPDHFNTHPYTS